VTCTKGDCKISYIGNTQQKLKARMGQHISETRAIYKQNHFKMLISTFEQDE